MPIGLPARRLPGQHLQRLWLPRRLGGQRAVGQYSVFSVQYSVTTFAGPDLCRPLCRNLYRNLCRKLATATLLVIEEDPRHSGDWQESCCFQDKLTDTERTST